MRKHYKKFEMWENRHDAEDCETAIQELHKFRERVITDLKHNRVIVSMKINKIAEQITDRLFTNGMGKKAERLVLELPGKRDGGGWCRTAVEDRIAQVLREADEFMQFCQKSFQ